MRPVAIVTLSKYLEFFRDFHRIMECHAPDNIKVLVRDGDEIPMDLLKDWTVIPSCVPFAITRNINVGWRAVPETHDIFFVSDDIRFIELDTIGRIQALAYKEAEVGIISPRLIGRGSDGLKYPQHELTETTPDALWYPCPYVKRDVIDAIGYMDEGFPFGKDDVDYNIRAVNAGFRLAVTNAVQVVHLETCDGASSSARKTYSAEERQHRMDIGVQRLAEKHGDFDYLQHATWSQRKADGRL